MDAYEAVMILARSPETKKGPIKRPVLNKMNGGNMSYSVEESHLDWLKIVKACYEEAKASNGGRFAGAWVRHKVGGWFPGLKKLEREGILKKEGESTRGGRRAYYIMPDPNGVQKALHELRLLKR